ncbi:MAG: hypothetical protein WBZ36_25070 [Candidatus Nitrosopolaris sp.]
MSNGVRLFLANDLRFIERRLRRITDTLELNTNDQFSLLYSIKSDIRLETKTRVLDTTKAMLSEIKQLKDEFELEEDVDSLERRIGILLEEIWTTIADTRPEKILGYGKMSKRDEDSVSLYTLKLLSMAEYLLFNKPM